MVFKDLRKKLQNKIVLIDPTIHSNGDGGTYGFMDRGKEGIQKFFEFHSYLFGCMHELTGQFPERYKFDDHMHDLHVRVD